MPGPAPVRLPPLPRARGGRGPGRAGGRGPGRAPRARPPSARARWRGAAEPVPPAAAHLSLSGERRFAIWCWWCFGGKERWGDGRGDSGSAPQGGRPLPGHARAVGPGPVGAGARGPVRAGRKAPGHLESGLSPGRRLWPGHC